MPKWPFYLHTGGMIDAGVLGIKSAEKSSSV